jgi:GNAT superfamily N-acetyltransferase
VARGRDVTGYIIRRIIESDAAVIARHRVSMFRDMGEVPTQAVNVYTEPGSRRRGIARALMQAMMEWATDQGFDRLLLHASDGARPLYRSLGFSPTNEMRWSIDGRES